LRAATGLGVGVIVEGHRDLVGRPIQHGGDRCGEDRTPQGRVWDRASDASQLSTRTSARYTSRGPQRAIMLGGAVSCQCEVGWPGRPGQRLCHGSRHPQGPGAGNELGVPRQEGPRRDEPHPAQALGQQRAQSAEQRSVDPGQRWAWSVPRRSTATSCRSTRISTSLVASDRASSASQLNTRASAR
jgi:hypothetical protein